MSFQRPRYSRTAAAAEPAHDLPPLPEATALARSIRAARRALVAALDVPPTEDPGTCSACGQERVRRYFPCHRALCPPTHHRHDARHTLTHCLCGRGTFDLRDHAVREACRELRALDDSPEAAACAVLSWERGEYHTRALDDDGTPMNESLFAATRPLLTRSLRRADYGDAYAYEGPLP